MKSPNLDRNLIGREVETIIRKHLFKKKIIILYGARQTGKTTLVKKILNKFPKAAVNYFNCDEGDVQRQFAEAQTSTDLKKIVGGKILTVIDEAQRVKNIGLKLKLLADNYPDQQIIATGSSSFELSEEIMEPLTGRALEFWLYPLSAKELQKHYGQRELQRNLETLLIYGSYPAVVKAASLEEKRILVNEITNNYLYKDVLKFNNLKSSEIVKKLLTALALQIGSEVSYTELANLLGVDKKTIASYVEILEKAFVLFKLPPLHRNPRQELGRLRKIYFHDLGVRNSLINNQNPLSIRNDISGLWENFIVLEKKKQENFIGKKTSLYFWRNYQQQGVDLIEEKGGKFFGVEIKWQKAKNKPPKSWKDLYPNSSWQSINKDNWLEVLS